MFINGNTIIYLFVYLLQLVKAMNIKYISQGIYYLQK